MPYQSIFADTGTSTPNKTGGNSYASPLGLPTVSGGSSSTSTKSKKKKQDTQSQQPPAKQKPSILSSIVGGAKELGKSAIAGEQTAATGVARVLPGGTADIKAKAKATEQASKDVTFLKQQQKDGKATKERTNKLIVTRAAEGSQSAKDVTKTVKALPSKGQVAAGFASTAADIVSGGSFGAATKAGKAGRLLSAAKLNKAEDVADAAKAIKNTTKVKKAVSTAKDAAPYVAGSAAAGGLNAAAAGGNKKDVAENTLAGAVFPMALQLGGTIAANAGGRVLNKATSQDAKNLIRTSKTNQLLKAGKNTPPKTITAQVNQAHVDQGLIHPELKQTPIKTLAISADRNQKIDGQKVNQYAKQIKDGEPIEPIVTHTVNGHTFVVDGEHRLAAAKKLGIDTVPTVEKVTGAIPGPKSAETPAMSAPHFITQEIDKHYKGGKQGPEEAAALEHLRANPDQAISDYNARIKDKFGATNVVSGDDAKYVIPGFDSTKSGTYHEPASALAKAKYQQLLADDTTKGKPVLLMSGGSGAGKTSALKRLGINYDNYAAVIDTNSNKIDSAEKRIQQALASGREVQVFHVHRDPLKSFTQGVIPRGGKEGRIVPIENHLDTHYGSHEAIQHLHGKYKDHPLVDIGGASNDHGHGKAREMSIDKLPQMKYTRDKLKTILQKEVDNAHTQGKISTAERHTYHGTSEANSKLEAGSSQRVEPQRIAGSSRREPAAAAKVDTPTTTAVTEQSSRVYQRLKAEHPEELPDDVNYTAINLKEQAERATKLMAEDKQKLYRVATGQESSPDITSTSANIALAEKALDEGNTKLYGDLIRNRSLAQTRRGQELVSEKASISDNSTSRYVKELLSSRLEQLGKKHTMGINLRKTSAHEAATAAVDREIKKIDLKIRNKKLDTKTALGLLDRMECL